MPEKEYKSLTAITQESNGSYIFLLLHICIRSHFFIWSQRDGISITWQIRGYQPIHFLWRCFLMMLLESTFSYLEVFLFPFFSTFTISCTSDSNPITAGWSCCTCTILLLCSWLLVPPRRLLYRIWSPLQSFFPVFHHASSSPVSLGRSDHEEVFSGQSLSNAII